MSEHRCEPHFGTPGSPVTMARVFRLVLAYFDDGDFDSNAQPVLQELGDCKQCWFGALAGMTGVAAGLMPERGPQVVAGFDPHLTAALPAIAREESGE
jgi:hypothetical protein